MRFPKGLLVGLVAVGIAGCSGSASGPPAIRAPAVTATASSVPAASPQMKASASVAAKHFYDLYAASQYTAFWNLLAPSTKREVSRKAWVGVHEACPSTSAGKSRVIRTVTVFGNAAIVSETVAGGPPDAAEDVFNYTNGNWSYSLGDLSIYRRGSLTADVAAAKAAGFCTSWKIF